MTDDGAATAVDLPRARAAVDAALDRVRTALLGDEPHEPWAAAARYALAGSGKRLRGMLACAAYRACEGRGDAAPLAAAVEMLHGYSLVHDDLPCMDDDDVRRGRPTTHRVHGVPAAVLGGAALVPLALRAVAAACAELRIPQPARTEIVRTLCAAAGAGGMIAGQWLDLLGEREPELSLEELERLHAAKTGALIAASARVGGIAAGAPAAHCDALARYGAALGLAFQIVDDVLDVTGTTAVLGKTAGRDVALGKTTYPARLGVDGAMRRAHALVEQACATLAGERLLTGELRHIAELVITRTN